MGERHSRAELLIAFVRIWWIHLTICYKGKKKREP